MKTTNDDHDDQQKSKHQKQPANVESAAMKHSHRKKIAFLSINTIKAGDAQTCLQMQYLERMEY